MNGRIVLAALVLLGGAGIAVAGASPQSTLTPSQAEDAPLGPASVKGMVLAVEEGNRTFRLTDGNTTLTVRMDRPLPAAIEANRSLVARGTLVQGDSGPILEADEIQLGCPSKYQA